MSLDLLGRQAHCRPPPDVASFEELITIYAVIVPLPDVLVLLPPTAHQVCTDKNIGAAGIASNIVASAQIE